MPSKKKTEEEFDFEQAILKLETIVQSLESGEASLDSALEQYEAGIHLTRDISKKLNEAEKKIKILTKSLKGIMEEVDFEIEDEDEA